MSLFFQNLILRKISLVIPKNNQNAMLATECQFLNKHGKVVLLDLKLSNEPLKINVSIFYTFKIRNLNTPFELHK